MTTYIPSVDTRGTVYDGTERSIYVIELTLYAQNRGQSRITQCQVTNEANLSEAWSALEEIAGEWMDDEDLPLTREFMRSKTYKKLVGPWPYPSDSSADDIFSLDDMHVFWVDSDGYMHDVSMEELHAPQIENVGSLSADQQSA